MTGRVVIDWTKLIVALAVIVVAGAGLIAGRLSEGAAIGTIGTVVGYILGNGRSVAQGNQPGTALTRVQDDADPR